MVAIIITIKYCEALLAFPIIKVYARSSKERYLQSLEELVEAMEGYRSVVPDDVNNVDRWSRMIFFKVYKKLTEVVKDLFRGFYANEYRFNWDDLTKEEKGKEGELFWKMIRNKYNVKMELA